MTVKELIALLAQQPPNARVELNTHSDWQYITAENVEFSKAKTRHGVVTISSDDPHAEGEE